jgi:uncharacterized protein (DUF1810 family)
MWFVFPQIAGLGRSATAQRFAIVSLAEARAYLAHPVLGVRYRACVDALARLPKAATAERVLGPVDAMKLRSSLTLFAAADPDDPRYPAALARWFGGIADPETTARI